MGRYTRRRNARKFWENPLVNGCYTLSILGFVAGLFGLFAVLGKASSGWPIMIVGFAIGIGMIPLGKYFKKRQQK